MGSRRSSRIAELNDLAQNPDGLSILAASSEALSKSAVGFDKAAQETWKESSKQAWAPASRQNLSSSSSRFRGKVEPNYRSYAVAVGAVPSIASLKQFGRAEDHIFLNDLKKLREKFEEADLNGDGTLDKEEFINMFDGLFGLKGKNTEEILTFFNKIDYNCDGNIDWDEFCTYMYLEFHEREDVEFRSKKVEFQIPAVVVSNSPHKDSICRITNFDDGAMVTCSTDGVICFWSHKLTSRRIRRTEPGQTGKPKWVTDMALCVPQSKILIVTGDHEIQFYEMQNFEPYCQLKRLEAVPLKLSFWHDPVNVNETISLIGDKDGAITIITTKNIMEAFKYWKLGPKTVEGMPTYNISKLITDGIPGTNIYRWKLHSNWVSEVHFFPSLNNFASCSCDPDNSIVLGSPSGSTPVDILLQTSRRASVLSSSSTHSATAAQATPTPSTTLPPSSLPPSQSRPKSSLPARSRAVGDQRVFRVAKGVSTVDYCSKHNAMVTGSMDQIVRIWNPFIPNKPISLLFGQGSPVFAVSVESSRDRIYSIGSDNTVKVWHILDYCCLYTIIPVAHKVFTPIEAFLYNPVYKCIAMGTEQLSLLQQVVPNRVRTDIVQSHSHPLTSVRYSSCFSQVISGCEGAVVKVWDIYTGRAVFEFKTEESGGRTKSQDAIDGISAIEIDKSGKRLVTGTQNGQLKLWNYNNGHCIRILDKENTSEVTDMKFVSLNNNKYIVAVGWDRKINLFPDVTLTGSQTHQKPIQAWSLASENAHTEDILCVTFDTSHLMATSSFDGEVLVWSVVSCHVLAHLKSPTTRETASTATLQDEDAVHKVLFLEKRTKSRVSASLVASGPAGYIHFWNVYDTSGPMGRFKAPFRGVTCLAVDSKNAVLLSADCDGYVCFWNIKSYCLSRKPPTHQKKSHSGGHTLKGYHHIMVEQSNVLVTASMDGSVRMWTYEGHYIGTFGQEKKWQLGVPSSYQHPLSPSDTLLDPSNMIQLEEKLEKSSVKEPEGDASHSGRREGDEMSIESTSVDSVVSEQSREENVGEERERITSVFNLSESESTIDITSEDEDIDSLLKSYISTEVPRGRNINSAGKRLRHLRTQSAHRQHRERSNGVYTTLPCQPLMDESRVKPPSSLLKITTR